MASALQSSRLNPRISITDKIQSAIGDAIAVGSSNFGWQLLDVPKNNQLILNVPVSTGANQQQYVQNNITKAWCNFTGWEANCWELLNDEAYFGGNGFVGHAWNSTSDNGTNIRGFALQSFQPYGRGAFEKQCKMVRFHLLTDGSPSIYGNVNTDYDTADTAAQLSAVSVSAGLWDSAVWDVDVWGSAAVPVANWDTATALGYTFAPVFKVASSGVQVQWVATDLVIEGAGIL